MDIDDFLARMKPQSDEFDALNALVKAYRNLPAVVDDDYPACRHVYEGAVRTFLAACKANGRGV
jgi:hypothetical protein